MIEKPVDFYCSQKFTWLSVDLEKRLSYSCCSATPEKLDINWLQKNPGELFNTPGLHQDRIDMLNNRPVSSCHETCWKPESKGLASRRTVMKSHVPTHNNINEKAPTHLNIILGSTCNMTCSYCCKQYSSSWYRDIKDNGAYFDNQDRYQLVAIDHVLAKTSHSEYFNSSGTKTLIQEISKLGQAQEVHITGGEPFLYNEFPDLLNCIDRSSLVSFYTGLGVNTKRLQKQLAYIKSKNNLQVVVSAENCGKSYEFNRYGNNYNVFLDNLKLLTDSGFSVKFNSVVSNLTVFGLAEFAETFKNVPVTYQLCNDPDFLAVNVLDDDSKEKLICILEQSSIPIRDTIIQNMSVKPTQEQHRNCSKYVKEFALRRNLDLDIFPNTMLEWLNHVV
jgi:molybdenum cofactor biosynthesis enzyme MoaA